MLSTRSDNTPKIPPRTLFWGPYNAKPIIKRALCKSHVNRATKLKLYSYMGIGKYLWVCPKFSAIILETIRARKLKLKTQLDVVKYSLWLHSVNFPMISGNCYATARKLNLKIPLDMVKYPFWVQKMLHYTTQHEGGRHIEFRQSLYLRGRLRLTTARRLSAYISSRALATTTTSSYNRLLRLG